MWGGICNGCNTGTGVRMTPRLTQHPRAGANISGNAQAAVFQLICYVFMASLYLYRYLLHSIMVFKQQYRKP